MKILILGSRGMLGKALAREAARRSHTVIGCDLAGADYCFDITNDDILRTVLNDVRPDIIINTVALVSHDACENDPGLSYRVNARPVSIIAQVAREIGSYFVHISTDHFYTGDNNKKHTEDDAITLINEYARSKYLAECLALTNQDAFVVRTNIVGFRNEQGRPAFVEGILDKIQKKEAITLFDDYYTSSIDVGSFSRALFDLIAKRPVGLINLASSQVSSKKEFIEGLARVFSLPVVNVTRGSVLSLTGARRAESAGLDVSRAERMLGYRLPNLSDVLKSLYQERNETMSLGSAILLSNALMWNSEVKIGLRVISKNSPTYFIADIAANHDGDLERAKKLIWLAKEAGADAAKFQHFLAKKIVSDQGFKDLGSQLSHQSKWKHSVYETYEHYECRRDWTEALAEEAKKAGIDFFTAPYDYEALELVDKYIPAYKIGSGDVTWIQFIEEIAKKNKPVFLATGASTMSEVEAAVEVVLKHNKQLVLMQCNTNYTGSVENFKYVNLPVLTTYANRYPNMILGLSDHTPGHAAVLGAIALGARVIEKHFTDDNLRDGPDHPFSLNPKTWREMVDNARQLEAALSGDGVKRVEDNEKETVVLQRRSIRLKRALPKGSVVKLDDVEFLRPAPADSFTPAEEEQLVGKMLQVDKLAGQDLKHSEVA